ncbi:MAG: LamG domain-containing protein [Dehalococcoidia bacterium]
MGSGPIVEWDRGGPGCFCGVHLWQHYHTADRFTGLFANLEDTQGRPHILQAAEVITQNDWNHVAVTYSKTTGLATLYVNGVSVASKDVGSFTPQTSTQLHIGRRMSDGYSFSGLIDEIAIYSRALTAAEIKAIYDAGSAGMVKPPESAPIQTPPGQTGR